MQTKYELQLRKKKQNEKENSCKKFLEELKEKMGSSEEEQKNILG